MRKIVIASALLAVAAVGCKKTDKEGEMVIQKPVVGTVPDTVHTPTVDARMDSEKVLVPKVGMETATVKVPKVDIKKPQ